METALFTKILDDRSLEEACEVAAACGYDGIEPMGREPHLGVDTTDAEARRLRAHLDDLGLDVPCLATYTGFYVGTDEGECEAELTKLERFCEIAELLDVDLVRHGPGGPPSYEATDGHYQEGARWMRRAADVAAEYDKRLGVEIHGNTIVESATDAVRFLELVDRANVGAIHDAGNMYLCGEAYGRASVEALGDRLWHVHVKDERRVGDADDVGRFEWETADGTEYFEHALLGEGDVDFASVFAALREADYDGFLTDECHAPLDGEHDHTFIAEHEREALERTFEAA